MYATRNEHCRRRCIANYKRWADLKKKRRAKRVDAMPKLYFRTRAPMLSEKKGEREKGRFNRSANVEFHTTAGVAPSSFDSETFEILLSPYISRHGFFKGSE